MTALRAAPGAVTPSFTLVAGLLAHRKNGFFVFKDGYEYILVLGVACLLLGVTGPGRFSVDNAAGIEITGWAGGGIALIVAVVAVAGLLVTFYRPAPNRPPPALATRRGTAKAAPNPPPPTNRGPATAFRCCVRSHATTTGEKTRMGEMSGAPPRPSRLRRQGA